MKSVILTILLNQLYALLTPELIKRMLDAGLDALEDIIARSESKVDDTVILPLIKIIRVTFDIPDTHANGEPVTGVPVIASAQSTFGGLGSITAGAAAPIEAAK